jgi:acyl-CoA synthetase (AMP-forming)/AMP-acid ligase II
MKMTRVPQIAQAKREPQSLVDLLHQRSLHHPDRTAFTFLVDGDTTAVSLSYAALHDRARTIGKLLDAMGVQGERVLLLYPSGLDYIVAFFGCLYAGAIAVPGYPPRFHRSLERLQSIAADAHATVALTTTALLAKTKQWFTWTPELSRLHWLSTDQLTSSPDATWEPPAVDRESLALLQYTSGSTNVPKGVMLSHENLLHNTHQIQQVLELTENSVGVGWLPLHHDMGLIGSVLQPLYAGFPCILMSPMAFLQRPIRWLQAIHHYRATISGGPNFAYDLCLRKITMEQRETLDLSCWDIAINGAEPIRRSTIEHFIATFAPSGFRQEAFYPSYGLAEATLMASGGAKDASPIVRTVQKMALEHHQIAIPCIGNTGAQALVGCGKSLDDQQLLIVDPDTRIECGPDQIGEIWIAGRSVARGYWNHPQATHDTFAAHLADTGEGPFLRTGDLGFLHHGELFVTGRLKDVIVIRARTHYPQDIEVTVEQSHAALRPHCCAAIAVEMNGEERLVVVQEVERRWDARQSSVGDDAHPESNRASRRLDVDTLVGNICQAVAEKHDVQVSAVILIRSGSLPKTSNGKIRRHACRTHFLNQTLDVVGQWYASHVSTVPTSQATSMGEEHAHREFSSPVATLQRHGEHVA